MMEHKAYAFDYASFANELRPILEEALREDSVDALREFIQANLPRLLHPAGGPLPKAWEDELENSDVHEYGDFALTRFYDPGDDIGLGEAWVEVAELYGQKVSDLLLGRPIGGETLFDPGRLGSYFQSADDVEQSLAQLRVLLRGSDAEFRAAAFELFEEARGRGLYVTF
jgi:hypothetical protein